MAKSEMKVRKEKWVIVNFNLHYVPGHAPLISPSHMASLSPRFLRIDTAAYSRFIWVEFHFTENLSPVSHATFAFAPLAKSTSRILFFSPLLYPFPNFPFSSFSLTFHHPSLSYCMIENSFQCAPSPHPLSLKWNEQLLAASMG